MVDKVSKILARTELQDSSCVLLENLLRLPAAPVVVDWLRTRCPARSRTAGTATRAARPGQPRRAAASNHATEPEE